MIDINTVIKEVSTKFKNVDKHIISEVCKHPFVYTVNIMKDDEDTKDILFNKLFKFKLKRRYKENKQYRYSSK